MGELVVLPSSLVTASSFSLCEPRFLIILFILAFSRTDSVFVQNSRHLLVLEVLINFWYFLTLILYSSHSGWDLELRAFLSFHLIPLWAFLTSGVNQGGGFILLVV